MQARRIIAAVLLSSAALAWASAASARPTISFKPGTLGLGTEVTVNFSPYTSLRLGGYYFQVSFNGTIEDTAYKTDVGLFSGAVFADWHPFASGFRVSAGLFRNQNKADVRALAADLYTLGGQQFTAEEVGALSGRVRFPNWAPFIGLGYSTGWDNLDDDAWRFSIDAGVIYQGKPRVALASEGGTLSGSETLNEVITREAANAEDDLNAFRFYPVFQVGVGYAF